MATASPSPNVSQIPKPYLAPGLHWAVVLLLDIVTLGWFEIGWGLYLSLWIRKVRPLTNATFWYSLYAVAFTLCFLVICLNAIDPETYSGSLHGIPYFLLRIGTLVVSIGSRYSLAWTVQDYFNSGENYRLRLSGIMIFFFSIIYLQYHLQRIRRLQEEAMKPGGMSRPLPQLH